MFYLRQSAMKITQTALIYRGSREEGPGGGRITVARDGVQLPLSSRVDLRNHSPTGMNWGYLGSGPAQLSLALLADYFGTTPEGDCLAQAIYHDFKATVIAKIQTDIWQLSGAEIGEAIVRVMVEDEEVIRRVISALHTFLYTRWIADHEGSEDLRDYENVTIDPWIEEGTREFLTDYLPLQPETVDRFIKARA
jgi:hypothetical protein